MNLSQKIDLAVADLAAKRAERDAKCAPAITRFLNYGVFYLRACRGKTVLSVERHFFSYRDREDAEKTMRSYKRRGMTAWVVDRNGNHVPVKGALKPIKGLAQSAPYVITCMCGMVNPCMPIAEDGLERCEFCGCH